MKLLICFLCATVMCHRRRCCLCCCWNRHRRCVLCIADTSGERCWHLRWALRSNANATQRWNLRVAFALCHLRWHTHLAPEVCVGFSKCTNNNTEDSVAKQCFARTKQDQRLSKIDACCDFYTHIKKAHMEIERVKARTSCLHRSTSYYISFNLYFKDITYHGRAKASK